MTVKIIIRTCQLTGSWVIHDVDWKKASPKEPWDLSTPLKM
jgi:hypothetical protein